MKILAIRIKNLASLDGYTEIDFTREPLCSAGIFAITGPTGAGKSTLLDALCLALYAKTPRYKLAENGIDIKDVKGSTIKQDDVRGILRDGTSEGFAEVDFEGIDMQHYRACWSVRRARNKADGNLQAYEIALKNITTNQDIPGSKKDLLDEIERLVGLNFEQFTRSVLLAQGDFTAFLKAGKDEKSSLLEKLTGTRIYSEISRRIFENHKEQHQKLRELNLQCEGIATLTTEELYALQEQRITLETTIKTDEQQIAILSKEINWHEQLIKLQEQTDAARVSHEQAFKNKEAAKPGEQQLQQVERVQAIKPTISNLQHVQEQLVSKSKETEALKEHLSTLQQQKEAQDNAIEKAVNDLAVKNKEQEDAQPLLNQAKALDVQLSEKAAQIKQETEACKQQRSRQQQQSSQLSEVQGAAHLLEQEIIKLNTWKVDNEARRSIAEQESLVLAKLEDAAAALKNFNGYSIRIRRAEEQITSGQEQAQRLEDEKKVIQESLQQIQPDYNALLTNLSKVDIQNIEKDKLATDSMVEDIVSATAHWKLLYHAISEKESLLRLLDNSKKELETQTAQLAEAERLLGISKVERDASLKSLEKARLVAAENIEQLRSQLVPNEPCPVCGSKVHPYATDNPVLDHVLAELETNYQQTETAYGQQLTSHSGLNEACLRIRKDIKTYETSIADKQTSLQELEQAWTQFDIYEESKNLPIEERTGWLQHMLQQQKEKQQRLQEQVKTHSKQKEKSEAYKAKLIELEKQLNATENSNKDNDRTLKSLQQQKINDEEEQQKANNKLEEVKQALSAYFTSEQWFQNWQTDPDAFTKRITGFTLEWRTNMKALEDNVSEQSVFAEKIKGMQEQSKNIEEELKSKEQKCSALALQWKDLSDRRKTLFNGTAVDEAEAALRNAVHSARHTLEQKKHEAEIVQGNITRNIAQNEQLEKDQSALSKQEIELKGKLAEWLNNYNYQHGAMLTEGELLPLLTFTQDWIEKERTSLRAIDDALIQATSILEERKKAFENHTAQRLSERTLETLTELQTEVQTTLKKNNQTVHEIDFRIKEDETNKQRIGQFLADIEKQALIVDNWSKLNEVIGSADGKKFRQVAQEYTLDVLLSYANVHLEILSKRYVLQRVPDSLGLQVVDQDMGDEIRTVYSLSGGESFLVSLALALGLASLSSSRMKVESLFIDEGFGSLDPATLNIAMDALERLHNQGRKVGVISHVQEMTERIPVQIKVSKQQSGRSKVEVVRV